MVKFKTKSGKTVSFTTKKKSRSRSKKNKRGGIMPRKKTRTRRSYVAKKKSRSKKSQFGQWGGVIGAFGYGALRARMSMWLDPLLRRLPAGKYADEVGMGIVNYLLWKRKIPFLNKVPLISQIGKAGLMIESARVGEGVTQGLMIGNGNATGGNLW